MEAVHTNEARQRIAILGGSFNPIHVGHLILASLIGQTEKFDKVWMMVSPMNPWKQDAALVSEHDRYEMVRLAVENSTLLEACDIEMSMPVPNYTVNTLCRVKELYPETDFTIIIGSDNFARFNQWKDPDKILSMTDIIVYPREGYPMPDNSDVRIRGIQAPEIEISSTMIREMIGSGMDANFLVPEKVYRYILDHKLYKK